MAKLFKVSIDNIPPMDGKLPPNAPLGEKIENSFVRFIQRVLLWGWEFIGELATNIIDAGWKILRPGMMRMFAPLLDEVEQIEGLPPYLKSMITRVKSEQGEAATIGIGVVIMGILYTLLNAAVTPLSNLVTQNVNHYIPTTIFPASQLAQLKLRGLMTDEQYGYFMTRAGYGDKGLDWNLALSQNHASLGELLELYRRGKLSKPEFDLGLARLGYPTFYNDLFGDLRNITPPVNDLIRFMVREAFNEETVAKFGYDKDYPADIDPFLPKVGLTADWGKRYWRSHWTLPSPTQAYEMLHRGEMTEEDLKDLLKTADYPEFWRDKMMNISYNVLTRIDVRRLLQAKIITPEKALKTYLEMGYKPDDAKLLTDYAVKGITNDEKDLSRGDILNMYEEGLTDRGASQTALVKMGYDNEEAEDILKIADVNIARAERSDKIAYIKERFLAKIIDDSTAKNELAQAGLKQQSVDRYLLQWTHVNSVTEKLPSPADARRWFIGGYVDEAYYRDNLKLNGYGQSAIDIYVAEAKDMKDKKAAA